MKKNTPLLILLLSVFYSNIFAQNYGNWYLTDSLQSPRVYPASVVLSNGNILVTGGENGETGVLKSCEIFDVESETWKPAAPMINARSYHELILLDNNKVLAIGGMKNRSCEIYDPMTDTWTLTDSLLFEIFLSLKIIKLNNGNILKTGGYYFDQVKYEYVYINKCEIFDVKNNIWFEADSLNFERSDHIISMLPNGKALVAGGYQKDKSTQERRVIILNSCETYDPELNKWEIVDSLEIKRYSHSSYSLANGNVFVSGGRNDGTSWLSSCEVYDYQLNQWSYVGEMARSRTEQSIMPYNKDHVIMFGGTFGEDTWEIYNINTFEPVFYDYYPARQGVSCSEVLPDSKVISIAGFSWTEGSTPYIFPTQMVLVFDPDYVVGIQRSKDYLPQEMTLYQNYPNPFNPTTRIGYSIPEVSNVKINIYDIAGRLVKTYQTNGQSVGYHNVEWDGRNEQGVKVSSGIYIYRMFANSLEGNKNFMQNKKMLMLK